MVLCLAGAWVIVCLCLIKGVQSSGKVVYFTALFPYFVLVILLVRGLTLPGAFKGIEFYVEPKLDTLKNIDVWKDAATQIFYSLGPAFGGLITLASYNRFDNNCHRDAVLIALANCSTSVFAGFVIFSILGFMANELGVEVKDVVAEGPGLAFIAYPEAVTRLPVSPLWSFLFFMMLVTLGLDSQFTMTENLTTAVMDQWPHLRKNKSLVVIVTSIIGFILGLTMCTNGGVYMFTLIDWYSADWSLLLIALMEIILLMYIYGVKNVLANIREMGIRLPIISKFYWMTNWLVCSPIILFGITIITWINFSPANYQGYIFPDWVQAMGWLMAISAIAIVVVMGIYEKHRRNNVLGKPTSWSQMFKPVDKWGPAVPQKPLSEESGYANEAFKYNSKAELSSPM